MINIQVGSSTSALLQGFLKTLLTELNSTMKKKDEMIFEIDKDAKKIMATIQRNDTAEKFECSLQKEKFFAETADPSSKSRSK